jgi:predicted nucleic acid-binding protein
MADIVVDSSVVVKWLTVEPHTPEALSVLEAYQAGILTLHAPDLINAEVGNIIWKKHLMQGVTATDAQLMLDGYRSLSFKLTATAELLEAAWHLAIAYRRTDVRGVEFAVRLPICYCR